MKLIIDIPEDVYKRTVFYHEFKDLNDCVESVKAIVNGTPLDDVKAEIIAKHFSIVEKNDFDNGRTYGYEECLGILNNIGKEGEE